MGEILHPTEEVKKDKYKNLKAQKIFEFTIKFIASGCFIGYFKFAPATIGTFFVGIPFYLFIYYLSHHCFFDNDNLCYFLYVIILTIISTWICGQAEIIFKEKDSRKIVLDEVIGYLFCMFFIPLDIFFILVGFILFRAIDIWKPVFFPLQNLPGGLGVMIDDCISGILTCVLLHIINFISQ